MRHWNLQDQFVHFRGQCKIHSRIKKNRSSLIFKQRGLVRLIMGCQVFLESLARHKSLNMGEKWRASLMCPSN